MDNDKIADVFDITPKPNTTQLVTVDENRDLTSDASTAKKNIRELIATGTEALLDALEVARSSESPRAYEVVANLMKQLADMNQQLVELYSVEDKAKNSGGGAGGQQPQANLTQVNNPTIFVGTTTELSKALAHLKGQNSS